MNIFYALIITTNMMFPTGVIETNVRTIQPLASQEDCKSLIKDFVELEKGYQKVVEGYFQIDTMKNVRVQCVQRTRT